MPIEPNKVAHGIRKQNNLNVGHSIKNGRQLRTILIYKTFIFFYAVIENFAQFCQVIDIKITINKV